MAERERKQYFIRRMTGGKSMVARVFDLVLFTILVFFAAFLAFYSHPLRFLLAFIAALTLFIIQLLVFRMRLSHFTQQETKKICQEIFTGILATMPVSKLKTLLGATENSLIIRQLAPVQPDDLLRAWREKPEAADCYLTAELTAEAAVFAKMRLPRLKLYEKETVYHLLHTHLSVSREQIDDHISAAIAGEKRARRHARKVPSGLTASVKYGCIGFMLLALSFVASYALYYRLLAGLAFFCSGLTGIPRLLKQKKAPQ